VFFESNWEDFSDAGRLVGRKRPTTRKENTVSDEQLEGMDRADEQPDEEDVKAHGFSAPVDPLPDAHATEEPPDVEGHGFSPAPVDPRPMDP
jgi:hypothetical protein